MLFFSQHWKQNYMKCNDFTLLWSENHPAYGAWKEIWYKYPLWNSIEGHTDSVYWTSNIVMKLVKFFKYRSLRSWTWLIASFSFWFWQAFWPLQMVMAGTTTTGLLITSLHHQPPPCLPAPHPSIMRRRNWWNILSWWKICIMPWTPLILTT